MGNIISGDEYIWHMMGLFGDLDIHKLISDTNCDIKDIIDVIEDKLEQIKTEELELNGAETFNVDESIESKDDEIYTKMKRKYQDMKGEPLGADTTTRTYCKDNLESQNQNMKEEPLDVDTTAISYDKDELKGEHRFKSEYLNI